jgi:sugar phosphate isomerase/epimerase
MNIDGKRSITRRQWLCGAVAAVGGLAMGNGLLRAAVEDAAPATKPTAPGGTGSAQRYRISAADWMLLKRQKPGALKLAHDCGLDGIEVDMGPLGKRPDFENNLVKDDFRQSYVDEAKQRGLEISSLAMSAFYGQPFADHPKAEHFLQTWIELMPKLGTRVGFLPIISKGDLSTDSEARKKLVALFKNAAPGAEKRGLVLGLNTQLDADGNTRLLDAIGSPAVRVAYNCGEAVDAKRDVYRELRQLGRERIAEIVPTLSDGKWLQDDDRLDVPKLKGTLDDIGWGGWLVLQRSRRKDIARKPQPNFTANGKYLKSIFQA